MGDGVESGGRLEELGRSAGEGAGINLWRRQERLEYGSMNVIETV